MGRRLRAVAALGKARAFDAVSGRAVVRVSVILYVIRQHPFEETESTTSLSDPPTYREALDRVLACAVFFHGVENLADLASLDLDGLLEESGLGEVANEINIADALGALPSEVQIGSRFSAVLDALDDRRRLIARLRTYAREPVRLAALGAEFGVSRERARQLEVRLRWTVEREMGEAIRDAAGWLTRAVGLAAPPRRFGLVLNLLVGDATSEWREAAEVAVMAVAGYERLDDVVGNADFRELIMEARRCAPELANAAGVIDEPALSETIGAEDAPEWEALVRNAGLVRLQKHLVLRDTRRARVFLALHEIGERSDRQTIARVSGLRDSSSLSSLLSSDPLFVRFTKDKWGLRDWADEPYGGVVDALVKRIEKGGGKARLDHLLEQIPQQFEVLPATVRNYLGTRKFKIEGKHVMVAETPTAPRQSLEDARDIRWAPDGTPALRFVVGHHHLKGNSQKIPPAVAQHLGVGLDGSAKIPFEHPAGVHDASVIWRSYDPNGPEIGRLREALAACAVEPGSEVFLLLRREGFRVVTDGSELSETKP